MPSYVPPKKNTEYIIYIGLVSQANTKTFQTNPTIAAGDFKVSTDGGPFDNLDTLPVVTPAGGKAVKITLSAAEMNGDNIVVVCSDAAGAEWCDFILSIQDCTKQIDDLPSNAQMEARTIASADYATAANLATVAGYLDTEIAEVLADTNELQAAWADGGRLDLILDIAAVKTGISLAAAGLDAVLLESGITGSASLTNDTGAQLTSINARQGLSLILSAGAGVLSGVSANTPAFKPGGKPAGNTRISAAVTSDGRTAVTLKVPD